MYQNKDYLLQNLIQAMFKKLLIFVLVFLSFTICQAQETMAAYIGEWQGKTENANALNLDVTIKRLKGKNAQFTLSNTKEIVSHDFQFDKEINLVLDTNFVFSGIVDDARSEIKGFIKNKGNLYPTTLYKSGDAYKGKWDLSIVHYLQPQSLRLTIKESNIPNDEYRGYPILGGLWCNNFKKENTTISFVDNNTNLEFEGQLKGSEIVLNIGLLGNFITKASFRRIVRSKVDTGTHKYAQIRDGWEIATKGLTLRKMEEDIRNDTLVGIEGVLVAQKGKIVYENYFAGFNANIPHSMRSASKSISSAIIGIAIDDQIIGDVDEKLYDFIPQEYQYTKDALKSKITIKDLLTMSSGLDVNNKAYEDNYQESDNWLKTVLEAPMVKEPGTYADYGSANPFLLGVYLSNRLMVPLESYMVDKLFSPLGITNYIMNTDDTKAIPYFGGGFRLTPRDMLKFGQLYLNGGVWNGQQVISKHWVEASFKRHVQLQDRNKIEYGYQWWHGGYNIAGQSIETLEARGAGGQRIIVVPALEAVVVVTAGNYRNRKSYLSQVLFEAYVLPLILK